MRPSAGFIVSGEIGVDFIRIICTDFAPKIIWQEIKTIDPEMNQCTIIDLLKSLFYKGIQVGKNSSQNLIGLSLGVPGLVDSDTGVLLFAPNLKWSDVPLREILRNEFGALTVVDNEANLAALGEHYFGAAIGYDEVLYISAGVGLGGAILTKGELYKGASGFASEFGHMTVDPNGEQCNCGNRGCWETKVSQWALFRIIRNAISEGKVSVLQTFTHNDLSKLNVPLVFKAAQQNDRVSLDALSKIGHSLGINIASLVNAINPEVIVFGGILSLVGDYLLPHIREELNTRVLKWNRQATSIMLSKYGQDSCVMGGVATIYDVILSEPIKIRE